jgi:hydrogenase maturation protein HypF
MKVRRHILVKGVVQGVGFRPFIYQLANQYKLAGWVLNSSEGVVIEAEGNLNKVEAFIQDIKLKAPPLAKIESIKAEDIVPDGSAKFEIKHSVSEAGKFILVSPDIATCDDCLRELFDPQDRRYRYPFINCTNCGPRFTIIEDIPYDRPKTTMKKFKMCPDCQREYDDPANRRFHAQPNACPLCGPSLELRANRRLLENSANEVQQDSRGSSTKLSPAPRTVYPAEIEEEFPSLGCDDPIKETIKLLKAGKIVAIKGLGGFHLACDAENEEVVEKLRRRKHRYGKPLAIMLADIEAVREHCCLSHEEIKVLLSPQRPIVLLRRKEKSTVAPSVAPVNNYLGVMLPYTPLHHLLLKESGMALVMTSGNLSEEPIAMENQEALIRLKEIADYFLLHNRDIYSRYDDSVVRVFEHNMIFIRRARSFAPYPIHLPFQAKQILATGPEQKNTFCLTKENYAFLSQHIGDMENFETLEHFKTTLQLYKKLFRIEPEIVAYDLHPEYLATKFAHELTGVKLIGVQHHHAHIVSCLVEHNFKEPVIGVSFDGTGFGPDGTIWGGEFLIADWKNFQRVGHLRYVPMPGGELAIKRPYRMALSYLLSFCSENLEDLSLELLARISSEEIALVKQQIIKSINSPLTSSCGRLFDAIASLVGVRDIVAYEGQAAIELEMIANERIKESYPFKIKRGEEVLATGSKLMTKGKLVSGNRRLKTNSSLIVDTEPIIQGVILDLQKGIDKSIIAGKFHQTVVNFISQVCCRLREKTGIKTVALSGGVFQNMILAQKSKELLEKEGFTVLYQKQVPCNDGGISLGQVTVANFTAES